MSNKFLFLASFLKQKKLDMLVKGSFEDFIYIIVGIIWIGYSIYKGVQKNKQKNKPIQYEETESKGTKSAFESFLDEILEQEEPVTPYSPTKSSLMPDESAVSFEEQHEEIPSFDMDYKDEEVFSYDDYFEESNFGEESGVYETKAEPILKLDENPIQQPTKKIRKPKIDLRKAVIYSEILNRRYF